MGRFRSANTWPVRDRFRDGRKQPVRCGGVARLELDWPVRASPLGSRGGLTDKDIAAPGQNDRRW